MKRFASIILIFAALLSGAVTKLSASDTEVSTAATSEPFTTSLMEGTIGNYKICMKLTFNDNNHSVSGWYYYKSKGSKNKISLSGHFSGEYIFGVCNLTLTEKVKGKVTGTFTGEFNAGNWTMGAEGTWRSPNGKTLKWSVDGGGLQ